MRAVTELRGGQRPQRPEGCVVCVDIGIYPSSLHSWGAKSGSGILKSIVMFASRGGATSTAGGWELHGKVAGGGHPVTLHPNLRIVRCYSMLWYVLNSELMNYT